MTVRGSDWDNIESSAGALWVVRVIWGAQLLGSVVLLVVVVAIGSINEHGLGNAAMTLFWLGVAFLVVLFLGGSFARKQIYKRHWQGDAITPRGYFLGNLILLSMLEGATLFGLVLTLLHGRLMPMVIPPLIGIGLHIVNFPTGGPMQPAGMGRRAEK